MKKSEMQAHAAEYDRLLGEAHSAQRQGLYRAAVDCAFSAWDHVDGMMQYRRKYQDEDFESIRAIEIVLHYAPLLLDLKSLDTLAEVLKSSRRLEKNTSESLADKLADARERLWHNHRLWDHLEWHPEARQDELRQTLGGGQEYWRTVAEAWEAMALLVRQPAGRSYRLTLTTRMGALVPAKCSACGKTVEAPKAMLLEETACPHCATTTAFVFLAPTANAESQG
ncbi:MAG: hypothetical protein WD079_04935 [Phycisphaeraceae bacterium]